MVAIKLDAPTAADRQIVITREFAAPRELVFAAWSDPEHLAAWWGPAGYESEVTQFDFCEGGVLRLEMRSVDGAVCPCEGTFREIVPPERIVLAGVAEHVHGCGGGIPPRSLVVVTFHERNGRTLLTIETRLDSAADWQAAIATGYNEGWAACLDRLAGALWHGRQH